MLQCCNVALRHSVSPKTPGKIRLNGYDAQRLFKSSLAGNERVAFFQRVIFAG